MEKTCSKCNKVKNLDDFNSHTQNGKRPECKECQKKWHKTYRKLNIDKYKEKRKKEYLINKQKQLEYYRKPINKYKSYLKGAKARNIQFLLSVEVFIELLKNNCFYCNETSLIGIDRVDSSKGYTLENCVPCCSICNIMKSNRTLEEFLEKCAQITRNNDHKKIIQSLYSKKEV